MPVVSITLQRRDLERFENDPDGAAKIASTAVITDAASPAATASRPAGYFERMYGGVSAEVLWKPVNSRFGFGAEVNYVRQRAFNQLLGVQSYGVATGHVSAYWQG